MESTEEANSFNRNPTGKGGFQDHPELRNAGGRPKNSLKTYVARKLAEMSEEEKETFLKSISASEQWKMAEGNPSNDNTHKVEAEITIVFDDSFKAKNETPQSTKADS